MINVTDHIENPGRYIAAAEARIKANANKGRKKRFMELPGAQRAWDFLHQSGEFESTLDGIPVSQLGGDQYDDMRDSGSQLKLHPLVQASLGEFYYKMRSAIFDWFSLTEGQLKAVLDMIDRAGKRIEERKAKRAAEGAHCQHVGTVGKREDFILTLRAQTSFSSAYGTVWVNICEDDAGNKVVYKGSLFNNAEWKSPEKGDRFKVKATVKEHGERDGVKQTMIARPGKIEFIKE